MPWGEELKKRREELGCTLQTAEEGTKIRKLYLQALENDDFAVLPPRIYAIGFVKNYARFLGLDEEILVRQFKELAAQYQELNDLTDSLRSQLDLLSKSTLRHVQSILMAYQDSIQDIAPSLDH